MVINYKNKDEKILFSYNVYFRTQNNLILKIKNNMINISCPKNTKLKIINNFITENLTHINSLINNYNKNKVVSFVDDNAFVFILGKKIKIILVNKNINTKLVNNILFMKKISNYKKQISLLYSFLKVHYSNLFFPLVAKWIKISNKEINELKLRNMVSKWGICYNQKKIITLNIKLIHFNTNIIEYVILHEIGHLEFPNHSKDFWNYIKINMPDYKEKELNLKEYCI